IPHDQAHTIFRDKSGCIWVGTANGLAVHSPSKERFKVFRGGLSSNNVTALAQASDGRLWAATRKHGLNSIDLSTGAIEKYSFHPRMEVTERSDVIRFQSMQFDSKGNCWVGS